MAQSIHLRVAAALFLSGAGLAPHSVAESAETPTTNLPGLAQATDAGRETTAGAVEAVHGPRQEPPSESHPGSILQWLTAAVRPLSAPQRQILATLLDSKEAVKALDRDGRSALILAARLGDLETVKLLVERGAYVKTRDRFHKTALLYAVDAGRRDIVDYLASHGDLQSINPWEQREPVRK